MAKLDGKIALVSGAGRGIGQAIATKLAEEGARLVINDLDVEPAEETCRVVRRAGSEALPVIHVSPFWQQAIAGAVILLSVALNARAQRTSGRQILEARPAAIA